MQRFTVELSSEPSNSFRAQKAANSLDINTAEKLTHWLSVEADIKTPFNVGLILGNSGSGKTTLARKMFGEDCFRSLLTSDKPIIDQLPKHMTYDDCANALLSIGLTSVPCWIRPVKTLSNGQRARAEAVLALCGEGITVIDEWTSLVDRTVAKVMSHCVSKYIAKTNKSIVLVSCHEDVAAWLQPDWIIDCNTGEFRRLVRPLSREELVFEVRECDKRTWKYFSKYHYLSSTLPGGRNQYFGLYHGNNQIGFQCYTAYLPGEPNIKYSNRVVIHPDYCGFGLGMKFINATAKEMHNRGYEVRATFSSVPLHKARSNDPRWHLTRSDLKIKAEKIYNRGKYNRTSANRVKNNSFRTKVRTFSYTYIP